MPVRDFEAFLTGKSLAYEKKDTSDGTMFIMKRYILYGKYIGKPVTIGIKIPQDFPNTAPYGVHVKKDHGFEESIPSVNQSELGNEWEFWSRTTGWDPESRTPQHYLSQVDRWLEIG